MNVGKSLNKADLDPEGVNPNPDQSLLIPVISRGAGQIEPGVGPGGRASDTQVHFWLMQCIPVNIYEMHPAPQATPPFLLHQYSSPLSLPWRPEPQASPYLSWLLFDALRVWAAIGVHVRELPFAPCWVSAPSSSFPCCSCCVFCK